MGTSIELTIGDVSLDYSKNRVWNDYGFLFQASDLSRRPYEGIDYDYYAENPDAHADLEESELGFVRPLSQVLPRLLLLGHKIEDARAEYQALLDEAASISDSDQPSEHAQDLLTFDEFCSLACLYPVASLAKAYKENEKVAQGRFAAHASEFSRIPWTENSDFYWSESSYLSAKLCILSPLSMLQIFGLNPNNADAEVMWQFGPIVNAGYVARDFFQAGVRRNQSILVATEGASDARILRRALDLLRPDVADFFRFIDTDERHHFWGTGNLVKFAEGLLRIDIQNRVLILLDNDAEGVDANRKLHDMRKPGNMRSMVLPDIDELRDFPALGPEGLNTCDINGRAAAIECYLDLNLNGKQPAQVIWSNYKKEIDKWHGALEYKESYARHFMEQSADNIVNGNYDKSKLIKLLEYLIMEASQIIKAAS